MDAELVWAAEQDKQAMIKYCKRANKRRAFPPWGIPTEMTWTILNLAVNLTDPNELTKQKEQRAIQRAEEREDEEELEQYTTSGRMKI